MVLAIIALICHNANTNELIPDIFLFLCRFGRRKAILLFCIIRSVGGIMCVVAPAYEWFAVARVITGAGIMGGTNYDICPWLVYSTRINV